MQELRAHDKIPLRSSRYPSVRIQAHAIVPQLPHHALSFVKPDSIKPSRQDAVHRALTILVERLCFDRYKIDNIENHR